MSQGFIRWRPHLAVAFTLLVPCLVAGIGASWMASEFAMSEKRLDGIGPRYARLLGLKSAQPDLETKLEAARAQIRNVALPPDADASRAAAALQQAVRALAESASLSVSGSQILPPNREDGLEVIGVSLFLTGELPAVQSLLWALDAHTPRITVRSLSIDRHGNTLVQQASQALRVRLQVAQHRVPQ